ncbi:hypothetical protein BDW66DRAFT_135425 [Aspergillus desertorum]
MVSVIDGFDDGRKTRLDRRVSEIQVEILQIACFFAISCVGNGHRSLLCQLTSLLIRRTYTSANLQLRMQFPLRRTTDRIKVSKSKY